MIIVLNNIRYKKLKRDQYIQKGALHSIDGCRLFPLMNEDSIGQKPLNFSDNRDFYNIIGEEIPHLRYDWNVITGMGSLSKGDLIEKSGLDKYTFDYALPQQWLNNFVEENELDYHMVICTTVFVYTDFHRYGIACSCCNEVQTVLDKIRDDFESLA